MVLFPGTKTSDWRRPSRTSKVVMNEEYFRKVLHSPLNTSLIQGRQHVPVLHSSRDLTRIASGRMDVAHVFG